MHFKQRQPLLFSHCLTVKHTGVSGIVDTARLNIAQTVQVAMTSSVLKRQLEAIPGFEPGSPDSKSGVINHYTKSPVQTIPAWILSYTAIYE